MNKPIDENDYDTALKSALFIAITRLELGEMPPLLAHLAAENLAAFGRIIKEQLFKESGAGMREETEDERHN